MDEIPPQEFPIRWLTYRTRIRLDVDRAFGEDENNEFFTSEYSTKLGAQVKQLDDWLVKLCVFQIGLTAFQIIGFLGNDASLSLFGITLKQATGVKEIVLAVYVSMGVATWAVLISRDTSWIALDRIIELSTKEGYAPLAKLANPSPFNLKFYFPRQHEDWIFVTTFNKVLFFLFLITVAIILIGLITASIAISSLLFISVYRNPTLGNWSYCVLAYAGATFSLGFLCFIRFFIPMPYRDQSIIKQIAELERIGEMTLYKRMLDEVYGPNSKYWKKPWMDRLRRKLGR